MRLSKIDSLLAKNYAQHLLESIKYGENGVYFWFPGSGMTTIVTDIFRNKAILKEFIGGLTNRLKIIQLWGHLAPKRTLSGLLSLSMCNNLDGFKDLCLDCLKKGKEVVFVVGKIDNFSDKEKIAILKLLVNLNAINRRRIHIIFNSTDKPWFEQNLKKFPELAVLANRLEILPIVNDTLLEKYIKQRAIQYESDLTNKAKKKIINTYGGILHLAKEYIRSNGKNQNIELKLRNIWTCLPTSYQKEIEKEAIIKTTKIKSQAYKDLDQFGILQLKFYEKHGLALVKNSKAILPKILSSNEKKLWKYLKKYRNKLVSKDEIIHILWPDKIEEVSLWMIDQTISRFRKKLARAGIDPEQLVTIKKKGYQWKA